MERAAMADQLQFETKMKRMSRKHRRMARGAIASVNHDGLIIARPRRRSSEFPLKGIVLAIAAFFLFKAFLFVSEGPITYNERVNAMTEGSFIEQVGGFVMQADGLTLLIAEYMGRLF